jgi:molybdenum cofactor biosynthesis enzyme MoaA
MPFVGHDVPHGVVEVNQKCNISCRACYKDRLNYTKPLDQILREVDLFIAKRRLHTLTLAGGEPLLHPQLAQVIRYIADRGIRVQMLSNGLALTDDLLGQYKAAGLDEVYLHIDRFQQRPDAPAATDEAQLNGLRATLAERVTDHGITCSLALTLYRDNLGELPRVVRFILENKDVTRMLATCYGELGEMLPRFDGGWVLGEYYPRRTSESKAKQENNTDGEWLRGQVVQLKEVEKRLAQVGMSPFGFIGSSAQAHTRRWSLYYAFVVTQTDGTQSILHLSPAFGKVVDRAYQLSKALGKPYSFNRNYSEADLLLLCGLYGLAEARSGRFRKVARFLRQRMRPGARIATKCFTVQQGPTVDALGRIEHCRDCPDATVRDGKLVPVCLADSLCQVPGTEDKGTEGQDQGLDPQTDKPVEASKPILAVR